ncbi:transposase [Halobium palmae]|uniref:Transposase n=1 Tax=Halobium palmae TaxID=1776492 RepID=A0ABD5RVR7_9EURY
MTSPREILTYAYIYGIDLREQIREGETLCEALKSAPERFERLEDEYPDWHPTSYSFEGLLKLFVYRETTGCSYRSFSRYPELRESFGLDKMPGESVLSRSWSNRFNETTQTFVTTAAHYLVRTIHDRDLPVPEVRPKEEVADSRKSEAEEAEPDSGDEFDDGTIYQTTRLAKEHGFGSFDSGRAGNLTYNDNRFFELQTFIGMVGCGTLQGAARFKFRQGAEYGPHGDTHLRAVKQFDSRGLIDGFHDATEQLLSSIRNESSFRRPITAAIDITTVPYYGEVEEMPMVSGTMNPEEKAFKFATLSIVGRNVPLVLAVEPVRESSPWDQNPPNQIHRIVRQLVRRAKELVPIETVLCDSEFDSKAVYQTLSNLGVNYLIPKRVHATEKRVIDTMEAEGREVAVEPASVHLDVGSHPMRFLYVPSTKSDGTAVFATNIRVSADEAEAVCRRYSSRWQIENEYKSIKNDFLAKTSSKDYRVRLFYFVFAVLLHNIWRLTDFLLKAGVGGEMDYAPVLTAGECVELVCSALLPPD